MCVECFCVSGVLLPVWCAVVCVMCCCVSGVLCVLWLPDLPASLHTFALSNSSKQFPTSHSPFTSHPKCCEYNF